MGYWDATDQYLSRHGGRGPTCPSCGREMFAEDDHGRFLCSCSGGGLDIVSGMRTQIPRTQIPQVDTSDMSDEEKAKIAPINRLNSPPTAAETKVLEMAARGPNCMDDPEYWAACEALEKERNTDKGDGQNND